MIKFNNYSQDISIDECVSLYGGDRIKAVEYAKKRGASDKRASVFSDDVQALHDWLTTKRAKA